MAEEKVSLTGVEDTRKSALRKSFVGTVELARKDCNCKDCEKGRERASEQYESDVDHIRIKVVDGTFDKPQNIFSLNVRKGKQSKWVIFQDHLEKIFGDDLPLTTLEELLVFLEGKTFKWEDFPFEGQEHQYVDGDTMSVRQIEDSEGQIVTMWVPVELREGQAPETMEV